VLTSAKLASYVYTRDPSDLPGDWSPSTELADSLRTQLGLQDEDGVQQPFGTIVDSESGFVATILVSPESREVVVAFGGTTSGKVAAGGGDRPGARQWSRSRARNGPPT
jgi:hypothetical protein